MNRILLGLALALPTVAHAADAPSSFRRFALLAGANNGGRDRVTLRYAVDDARSLGDVLKQLGGVAAADERVLTNPSRSALLGAIGDLKAGISAAEASGARTELVVYYSGHSDESGLMLGEERFGYDELRKALATVPADVSVVILDSCASGAIVRGKGGTRQPALLLDESMDVSGSAYLTSSSEDESAQESDKLGGSFFTHYLVSGLRGAADQSSDGRVTLTEAYQFAYDETLQRTERTQVGAQHPEWDIHLAGTGDLVITDLRETTAGLVADEPIVGRINVRDDKQRLVAELYKPAGRRVELGLVPGRYRVLIDDAGHLREASFTVAEGGMVRLSSLAFTEVRGEAGRARGSDGYTDEALSLGILPGMGKTDIRQHLAISLGLNAAARLDGAQLAVIANSSRDGVSGAQIASVVNTTAGEMRGFQGSAAINHAGGTVSGMQSAAAWNSAGMLDGVQASGGVNVTKGGKGAQLAGGLNKSGPFGGFQAAGGFNVAGPLKGAQVAGGLNIAGPTSGLQIAGGLNVAGPTEGLQVAGGLNVAGPVKGGQIAPINVAAGVSGAQIGVVNVAKEVDGAQVSVINVAGHVKGAMIGVINVADDVDGPMIGVLSFSRTGYNHGETWVDAAGMVNAGVTFGGKGLFSTLSIGTHLDDPAGLWTAQLGLGGHIPVQKKLYVDVGASAGNLGSNWSREVGGGLLTRARGVVGIELAKHLAVYAGPTFDLMVLRANQELPQRPWLPHGAIPAGRTELPWRVGLAAGVRF